ncbi:MAG: hypothetical protein K2P84_11725 [Undibacterium sp.]|nr:hypothetical protein [Undibacterium sp.]
MANVTWIVKIENGTKVPLRYVDGEDSNRNGIIAPSAHPSFEGSGFAFPWVDINKGEMRKAIKFYNANTNAFVFQLYQSWNRDRLEWTRVENAKDSDAIVLSPDSSMGDRKAIIIDQSFVPRVLNQYPNYSKFLLYYNNWMNFSHREYYLSTPGDTGLNGEQASNYLTEIYTQLRYTNGPTFLEKGSAFNGYLMESWHVNVARYVLDNTDWGIEYAGGLTNPWRTLINTNGPGNYGGVVSHEMGHQYQNSIYTTSVAGSFLKSAYARLRQADFTSATNAAERFAEDFKFFFGVNGTRGHLDPHDDYYTTSGKVRHPASINGLKELMRGSWPVFYYLNGRSFTNISYNNVNWFQWYANNRWEAFDALSGAYSWHNGKQWVAM